MFCAIGEALLDAPPHVDEEKFMEALKTRFLEWHKSPLGGNHRAPGGTCVEAVRKMRAKVDWRDAGAIARGKGNGSAMRSGVVGAMYWAYPEYAFRIGCLTSVPTHNNLEAILSAGMVSFLVAASISGVEFFQTVGDGLNLCSWFMDSQGNPSVPMWPVDLPLNNDDDGQSPWKTVASFGAALAYGISKMGIKDFTKFNGDAFTAVPAVSEAIFYNSRFSKYIDVVLHAVNFGDDADTIGAISGTIAGSRFGVTGMPVKWVKDVEERLYLSKLADRIWKASQTVEIKPPADPTKEEGEYEVEL